MSDPAAFDVILFDLDGTLTDSAPGIVNCMRSTLDDMGIEHPDDATMRTFLGPPLIVTFGSHFGLGDAEAARAVVKYRERYNDVGLFENSVYDGIPELLDALGRSGATLAVATSKPEGAAVRVLEHFDLAHHFAFIGGAEHDGARQHKADVIEHTLAALTAQGRYDEGSSIVMVGDREHDVRGARAHGIDCIGVLWGYGDERELREAGAVRTIARPSDLLLPPR